jgi:outer membrane protein assembly factor BamA
LVFIKRGIYILFLFCFAKGYAQSVKPNWIGNAKDVKLFLENAKMPEGFSSDKEVYDLVQNTLQDLRNKGYITCNVDTSFTIDSMVTTKIFVGEKYKWAKLKTVNIPAVMLANIGYDAKTLQNKLVDFKSYAILCKQALTYAENNGYPFANMQLQNILVTDSTVGGDITFTKNKLITIDSIDIQGDAGMGLNYVQRLLNIKEGDLYNEAALRDISRRILTTNFLIEEQPRAVNFGSQKTTLILYLNQKNANRADAVIGFLPNNTQLGGKLLVTGDVKLNLVNSFNLGEQLNLNWQNLQYKSPRLTVDVSYPYVLGSAFGFTSKFNYTKNDTSFRTTQGELGLQYVLEPAKFLKVFYNNNSSRLLNVNISELNARRNLPQNVDYKTKSFGIAWAQNSTDRLMNPRKGVNFLGEFGAGIKTIIRNNIITDAVDPILNKPFAYLYDSLKAKTYKYQAVVQMAYYVALSKSIVLKSMYSGGVVYNDRLFKNELFQIGGYKILRGFDEASLFAKSYHVLTLEPHYSISRNSYFLLLVDAGKVNLPFAGSGPKNAFAFGAGLNLETKGGAFSLIYAVSNNLSDQIVLKNGKIHFGYVNNF